MPASRACRTVTWATHATVSTSTGFGASGNEFPSVLFPFSVFHFAISGAPGIGGVAAGEMFCENRGMGTKPKRCAAVRGTTMPGTRACRTVTGTTQATVTTTTGFGASGIRATHAQQARGQSRPGFRSRRERHARFRALVLASRHRAERQIQNRPCRPVVVSRRSVRSSPGGSRLSTLLC